MSSSTETPKRSSTPQHIISPVSPSMELRRRVIINQNQPLNVHSGIPANAGLAPVGIAPTQNPLNTSSQGGIRPVNTPIRDYR